MIRQNASNQGNDLDFSSIEHKFYMRFKKKVGFQSQQHEGGLSSPVYPVKCEVR